MRLDRESLPVADTDILSDLIPSPAPSNIQFEYSDLSQLASLQETRELYAKFGMEFASDSELLDHLREDWCAIISALETKAKQDALLAELSPVRYRLQYWGSTANKIVTGTAGVLVGIAPYAVCLHLLTHWLTH